MSVLEALSAILYKDPFSVMICEGTPLYQVTLKKCDMTPEQKAIWLGSPEEFALGGCSSRVIEKYHAYERLKEGEILHSPESPFMHFHISPYASYAFDGNLDECVILEFVTKRVIHLRVVDAGHLANWKIS